MRASSHLRALLAVLLGALALCLWAGGPASAHAHHHGHGAASAAPAGPKAVARPVGRPEIAEALAGDPAVSAGRAEAGPGHARHHALCCDPGIGCPLCLALHAESPAAMPREARARLPFPLQPPPPRVLIEALPEPPRPV